LIDEAHKKTSACQRFFLSLMPSAKVLFSRFRQKQTPIKSQFDRGLTGALSGLQTA
jgi:hypothetical protein